MRVLVTGSRGWSDESVVYGRLARLPADTVIVNGGAGGADQIAHEAALLHGHRSETYHADWEKYGKRAGLVRNLEMLDTKPDLVLAFWDGKSRGTAHCIAAAKVRGIPVEVIT